MLTARAWENIIQRRRRKWLKYQYQHFWCTSFSFLLVKILSYWKYISYSTFSPHLEFFSYHSSSNTWCWSIAQNFLYEMIGFLNLLPINGHKFHPIVLLLKHCIWIFSSLKQQSLTIYCFLVWQNKILI